MKLSHLASSIPGSGILAISNAVKAKMTAGVKIYNFTVGDFDPQIFPIPTELEAAIVQAYQERFTNYPAAAGNADLLEALSNFIYRFQGLHYSMDELLVAAGGRPLIYTVFQVIVDPGDTVIYAAPSWNNAYYCQFTQARPCIIQTNAENFFMPTASALKPHIEHAVLLALCSPQNPTGTCFSREQLGEICNLVVAENQRRGSHKKQLYILFDHMYHLLCYGSQIPVDPVSVCPAVRPFVIFIDAISKSFAATGVRLGWSYGPGFVIQKMRSLLSHIGAWAPMAEQKAVARFLENTEAIVRFLKSFKEALKLRLDVLFNGFMQLKALGYPVDALPPSAAIYLSVKIDIPDADRLLLEEGGIAILPFSVFGATANPNWYRLSVGTCKMEELGPMLKSLATTMDFYCGRDIR